MSEYLNDTQERAIKEFADKLPSCSRRLTSQVNPIGWTHSDYPKRKVISILEDIQVEATELLALLRLEE